MSRKDRFETVYDGSYQHITQRGSNKQCVFKADGDYLKFRSLIRRYLRHFKIDIYNYCLMPNHVHMLLQAKEAEHLPKFMQGICLSYSSYYRKKYEYTGYLWQGRFKNSLIEKDSYLLECARYIERNPLRIKHKTIEDLSSFRWSSYNFYAKGIKDDIVTENPLYAGLGNAPGARQKTYKEYVLTPRPYEESLDDIFRIGRSGHLRNGPKEGEL